MASSDKVTSGSPKANDEPPKVYKNILEAIGKTPLVKLNRIPHLYKLQCDIYVKCEYLNPGGSLKDRIMLRMMDEAEKTGSVHNDTVFVEPTSGNTGIGLSLCAAVKGYASIIVTPDKNSNEKVDAMRLMGSEVIQTPSGLPHDDPDSYMGVIKKILKENPKAICLDQFSNDWNPIEHHDTTAVEILQALDNKLDLFVMGIGTGGTITGVARRVHEVCPGCKIVAVDPKGSIIFPDSDNAEYHEFYVEGIGGDFIPKVLDKKVVDFVDKPTDGEAFNMARELVRQEGLLCGGSSGSIMVSAIKEAKKLNLGAGARVVVILPDGIRNYMTKFVSDQWMEAHLFKDPPEHHFPWWDRFVGNLVPIKVPQMSQDDSIEYAVRLMGPDFSAAIAVDQDHHYMGAISKDSIRHEATNPKRDIPLDFTASVKLHLIKDCLKLVENGRGATLGRLARMLDVAPLVVIVENVGHDLPEDGPFIPKGILTSDVMLKFIVDNKDSVR